jgi:hypothetical protein
MSKGPLFSGHGRIEDQKGGGVIEVDGGEGVEGEMLIMRGRNIGVKQTGGHISSLLA